MLVLGFSSLDTLVWIFFTDRGFCDRTPVTLNSKGLRWIYFTYILLRFWVERANQRSYSRFRKRTTVARSSVSYINSIEIRRIFLAQVLAFARGPFPVVIVYRRSVAWFGGVARAAAPNIKRRSSEVPFRDHENDYICTFFRWRFGFMMIRWNY